MVSLLVFTVIRTWGEPLCNMLQGQESADSLAAYRTAENLRYNEESEKQEFKLLVLCCCLS